AAPRGWDAATRPSRVFTSTCDSADQRADARLVGSRVEPGHHALVEGVDGTEGIITQSGAGLTPALGDGRGIAPWRESPHVIRGRASEGDLGGSGVQIGLNRQ